MSSGGLQRALSGQLWSVIGLGEVTLKRFFFSKKNRLLA
jgi:hypothetical protein